MHIALYRQFIVEVIKMNKLGIYALKFASAFAAVAVSLNVMAINPICHFIFHDAKVPEELYKLKDK